MNRAALKLLLLQIKKMIDLIIERWDDAVGDEIKVDGVVDDAVVRQERLRDELRLRGVNV
jgi:hypothetical protein